MRDATYKVWGSNTNRTISIHASHAGRDLSIMGFRPLSVFQSTRPMRDATVANSGVVLDTSYFNPRIPCGTRLGSCSALLPCPAISIHASHAGRDLISAVWDTVIKFQSTRPMRDATTPELMESLPFLISIHASHAGRDSQRGY